MAVLAQQDILWRSHWLQQALAADPDLAPPLEEQTRADVCIVGGGYLGLWTAIRLREANPGLDVVIVERDICGGGPSGRNSGMLLSAWTKLAALSALKGEAEALRVVRLSMEAIDGIAEFCAENGIDCWLDRVGWIWGATCAAQNGAWNDAIARYEKHGEAPARRVSRDEIAAMTGSHGFLAGAFDASAATVQPAFLARGLRRVALSRGVRIYEKTPMRRFSRRSPLVVETERGSVTAAKIVLAMNAWSAGVTELAPALFNISSDDAASLPMPEKLEKVGYSRGPLMIDSRVFVAGWRVTRDGRLNVGVTGGHIGFGGLVDQRFHGPSPRVEAMRAALRDGHPALADFPLATAWEGPIDRTDSGLPLFGRLTANPDILYGYGFSGNGIGMTYLGGKVLTSLALGRDDGWADMALVRPVRRGFPPEPFRFVGAHFVRGAVRRRDKLEHAGRKPDPVTAWVAGLAPSGVTPSKANITSRVE
ncbi:MAG: FAD-dependent oxidoreductase [Rhizobiaceae bacterium]|nr:FAD-dependent oxidoreductase [Rhizobiaceae bacterium]